jgi:hypothetical protein
MRTRFRAAVVAAVVLLTSTAASAADKKVIRIWQTETEPADAGGAEPDGDGLREAAP